MEKKRFLSALDIRFEPDADEKKAELLAGRLAGHLRLLVTLADPEADVQPTPARYYRETPLGPDFDSDCLMYHLVIDYQIYDLEWLVRLFAMLRAQADYLQLYRDVAVCRFLMRYKP